MKYVLVLALLIVQPAPVLANEHRAGQMCQWLDSLAFTKGKCQVTGKAVDIRVEAPDTEAAAVCGQITKTLRGDGVKFDRGWKLRIFNPRTGNNLISECKL